MFHLFPYIILYKFYIIKGEIINLVVKYVTANASMRVSSSTSGKPNLPNMPSPTLLYFCL